MTNIKLVLQMVGVSLVYFTKRKLESFEKPMKVYFTVLVIVNLI